MTFLLAKGYITALPPCHDNYQDNPWKKTKRFEGPAFLHVMFGKNMACSPTRPWGKKLFMSVGF